jgi:hypothetical protein
MKYPRRWKNKESGKELRVMPWWEQVKNGEAVETDELGQMLTEVAGQPCKMGVIVQVGYLLENEHGVWFGVGPSAAKSFEDLGEAK